MAAVLPDVRRGAAGAAVWSVETRPPGYDAGEVLVSRDARDRLVTEVVERMTALYAATARPVDVAGDVSAMLEVALAALEALPASRLRAPADAAKLEQLEAELREQLRRGDLTIARVHGNLWPGNVVCAPRTTTVTGIVNWEWSGWDLPGVDVMHLLLTSTAAVEGRELGAVVRDVLAADRLAPPDAGLLAGVPGAGELSVRSTVLLAWLRHVRRRIERDAGVGAVWVSHNVHQVLESV
jgi:hypothetical protein